MCIIQDFVHSLNVSDFERKTITMFIVYAMDECYSRDEVLLKQLLNNYSIDNLNKSEKMREVVWKSHNILSKRPRDLSPDLPINRTDYGYWVYDNIIYIDYLFRLIKITLFIIILIFINLNK